MILRAFNALLMFLSTVLLARILGVEGYGVFAFVYSLALVMTLPAEAGMSLLVLRETAKGMAEKRYDRVKGVLFWGFRVVLLLSGLVVVIGLIAVGFRGFGDPVMEVFVWALPLVPAVALTTLSGGALRGFHHIVAGQVSDMLVRPGVFVALLLPFLVFPQLTTEPDGAMGLFVVAALAALITSVWLLKIRCPKKVRNTPELATERYWLKSSLLFGLMTGMGVLINQVSTILLGWFDGAMSVGIYRVALQISMLATFGLNAVNQVVAPRFARLYSEGEIGELQDLVNRSAKLAFLFSIFITLGFVCFGELLIVTLFGDDFVAAFWPLMVLLVGQIINAATGPVGYLLNMTGNEKESMMGVFIAVIVALVSGLIFVMYLGEIGAALAGAVSMVVWNIYLWDRAKRILGINSMVTNFNFLKR